MSWLAILDRLSTMDRVSKWSQGVDTMSVLCKGAAETRNHLFYECSFTGQILEHLTKRILGNSYTNVWSEIVTLISKCSREKNSLFCIRYALQVSIHTIWRERNKIRHGEKPLPLSKLKKLIDKGVRNKLSLMRSKGLKGRETILQFWFETRLQIAIERME